MYCVQYVIVARGLQYSVVLLLQHVEKAKERRLTKFQICDILRKLTAYKLIIQYRTRETDSRFTGEKEK